MSDRWPHRIAGIVCYLIFFTVCVIFIIQGPILGISGIFIYLGVTDVPWIAVGLAMSVFGAELPDYDRYRLEMARKKKGKGDNHKIDNDDDPKKGTTTHQKNGKISSPEKILRSVTTHRSGLTHSPLIPVCILIPAFPLMPAQGAVVATILMVFFLFGHASHLALDIRPSEYAQKGENGDKKTKKLGPNGYRLHFGIATPSAQETTVLLFAFSIIEIAFGIAVLVLAL
jgi:hypothetical protein